jgi:hypothetical protein
MNNAGRTPPPIELPTAGWFGHTTGVWTLDYGFISTARAALPANKTIETQKMQNARIKTRTVGRRKPMQSNMKPAGITAQEYFCRPGVYWYQHHATISKSHPQNGSPPEYTLCSSKASGACLLLFDGAILCEQPCFRTCGD